MAENINLDLIINASQSVQTIGEARKALRDLKSAALQVSEGSEAFNKVTEAAGALQDRVGDLNARVRALSSDTRKLDTIVGVMKGAAAGFAVAQGAAALFGNTSKDIEKTLVKVQGAMALLNGIETISNLLKKESTVLQNIQIYKTNLLTAAFGAQRVALAAEAVAAGTATVAQRLLNAAMEANPVGLLIVGITSLIGLFTIFSDSTEAQNTALKDNNKQLLDLNSTYLDLSDTLTLTNLKLEELNGTISKQSADIVENQIKTNKKLRDLDVKRGEDIAVVLKKIAEERDKWFNTDEELVLTYKQQIKDINKYYDEQELLIEKQKNADKEVIIKENIIKEEEIRKQAREEARRKVLEEQLSFNNEYGKYLEKNINNEIELNKLRFKALIEDSKSRGDLIEANRIQRKLDLYDLNNKYDDEHKAITYSSVLLKNAENKKYEDTKKIRKLNRTDIALHNSALEIIDKNEKEAEVVLNEKYGIIKNDIIKKSLTEEEKIKKDASDKALKDATDFQLANVELAMSFNAKTLDNQIKYEKQRLQIMKDAGTYTLKELIDQENKVNGLIQDKSKEKVNTYLEYARQVGEIFSSIIQIQNNLDDARINSINEIKDAQLKAFDEETQRIDDNFNQISNQDRLTRDRDKARTDKRIELEKKYNDEVKKIQKEQFERNKINSIAQVAINTAEAISKTIAKTGAAGIILSGLVLAAGLAQVAAIETQQFTGARGGILGESLDRKYANGGVLNGPSHAQGGIPSRFGELEGGEAIINKRSTQMFMPILSAINQAGGGKRFAMGTILPSTTTSNQSSIDLSPITALLANREPLRAYVSESEITSSQKRINKLKRTNSF